MTGTTTRLPIYLNPLLLGVPKDRSDHRQIASNLFDFLAVGSNFANRCDQYLKRYEKLLPISGTLYVIPLDKRLEEKLIVPLRQAYASFLLGNYLGTLGLCGMIGEMLAIFKFDISSLEIEGRIMSLDDQRALFGNNFERLGQERRIEVLHVYGVIKDDYARLLEKIRKIRNNYLHFWSRDHDQIENDAYQVLVATIEGIKKTFPQEFEDGKVLIGDEIVQYLSKGENEGATL